MLSVRPSPIAELLADAVAHSPVPLSTAIDSLGLDPHEVHDWLAGTATPDLHSLFAFLEALDRRDLHYPAADALVRGGAA